MRPLPPASNIILAKPQRAKEPKSYEQGKRGEASEWQAIKMGGDTATATSGKAGNVSGRDGDEAERGGGAPGGPKAAAVCYANNLINILFRRGERKLDLYLHFCTYLNSPRGLWMGLKACQYERALNGGRNAQ